MTTEKPIILFIPGAWHQGGIFEPVANILRAQGYQAEPITLPSVGGLTSTNAYDDAEHICKTHLNDLVAQGKEVILVMHSYGGIPGTESVKGLARKDIAAQGEKVESSASYINRRSWSPLAQVSSHFSQGDKMYPKDPREKFYNDLDDETASKYLAAIVHHAPETMRTPLTYEAYCDVPTNYILCTRDAGFPLFAQQKIAAIPGEGVVRTYSVDAGHFAMLSQPQAVADVIHDVATRIAG
ncbi:alpha/beta-hydrolase [Penicillium alfredii]|uniref:Alpha/beta-hydrolase n=1 Tax=Penicillium alfredii TaxID=1506179 RepID=A0A9W9F0R8_9EURO|nr:alpha/beta-hydrolase [Penicillium alfredii]KAJ5091386.1 alpha/beta-hydrolase [Penicillium alfredii]